jgi:hypothetical protein
MNKQLTPYKRLSLAQLISAYQRSEVSDQERDLLANELARKKIDLNEAKRMKVDSLQDIEEQKSIDRAVMKERGLIIFWRIFWRLVAPPIAIFVIIYGLQFWDWLTK